MPKITGTPQQLAKRWADGARANVQRYVEGVNAVTESPTAKAASAVDRYGRGCQEAVSNGKFVEGCNAVSLDDWKRSASGKGKANMATGVTDAEGKMARVFATLIPHCQMVSDQVAAMPKGTLEDSKQRAIKAIELMSQYRKPR